MFFLGGGGYWFKAPEKLQHAKCSIGKNHVLFICLGGIQETKQ